MKKVKVIIFIVALVVGLMFAKVFGAVLGFSAPTFSFNFFSGVRGSGVTKVENRNVSGFKKIEVSGTIELEVTAQNDFSVNVEADDNLLELIKTEVDGDTLKIYTEKRISTRNKIHVVIAMPELTEAEVSGACKVTANNVKTDSFKLDVSGASKIEINGEAKDLKVEASGASKINTENLKVANADVEVSGATSVIVNATEEVKAEASGASKINYVGEPKNVEKHTSGASRVSQK